MRKRLPSVLLFMLVCMSARGLVAGEVRITGSSTVFVSLVKDAQDAVQAETGVVINAVGSTSGRGLRALQGGFVQIAMLTGRLANVAPSLSEPGNPIHTDDLVEHFIKEDRLVVVVHPSNPVTSLSAAQVRQILIGQTRNWHELGGAIAPISVFYERAGAGNNVLIQDHLLKDAKVRAPALRYVDNSRLIVHNVRRNSSGFGLSSRSLVTPDVKVVEGFSLVQELCLVTRKDASPEVLAVVKAFLARAK